MDWNLISIIVFYILIALFFIKNRRRIDRQGIFILYRTQRGLNLLARLAEKHKRFWKAFGKVSIYVGFGGIIFILAILTRQAIKILTEPAIKAGVALAIPGVRVPGSPIFIPFWYGIISLIIVLVVHEGCHGLVAKAHGLKLKSAGVGLLTLLPLAFVEPDEKQLDKAPLKTRLAVFGAGPLANFTTALVVLLLSALIVPVVNASFEFKGMEVTEVREGFPAEQAGLTPGNRIIGVNGKSSLNSINFSGEMDKVKPGETVIIKTEEGNFSVTTISNPENESQPYLGVTFLQKKGLKDDVYSRFGKLPWIWAYLLQLFNWIFILNLGIGAINLLPLGPIDGGRMIKDTLGEKLKNKKLAKQLVTTLSYASLFLLIVNILGPYFMSAGL
ncbi:MAG: site-2 protease family protein [Candidatus Woesearchaeota archaeon]|nr:MAG: site-2 protease family protein [Candidatus Woesearchaeota archaeon]